MGNASKILIVEDDPKIALSISEGLSRDGFLTRVSHTGEDAFFLIHSDHFDLILLDIMLPGRSGLDILKAIRKEKLEIPLLLLTARDAIDDRVEGLEAGADDYLIKPFAFSELVARIKSLLRRTRTDGLLNFQIADLTVDVRSRHVARQNREIDLTHREFELLDYLFRHKGNVVSREMLSKEVWKEAARATPLDNVIDVHMMRLRKKIDGDGPAKLIHTVRGVGFILKEGAADEH
jgi:two-component system, OmpR family, copper resistance phosphate regulon response regulator CusR